jgi:hypothetical protein
MKRAHHHHEQGAMMAKAMSRVGYVLGVAVLLSGFALPPQAQG